MFIEIDWSAGYDWAKVHRWSIEVSQYQNDKKGSCHMEKNWVIPRGLTHDEKLRFLRYVFHDMYNAR